MPRLTWLVLLSLASACEHSAAGELSRGECTELATTRDRLIHGELGRANDAVRRQDVDRCAQKGTKRWAECLRFAQTAVDAQRCDELIE